MEPPRPEINVKWDSKDTFFSAISLQKMQLKEVQGQKLLHAVFGNNKNIYFSVTSSLVTFFARVYLQLFQRIRIQHQILRFL
jgi:hypothetical protein